ncbi:hypothetical protein TRFO_13453 [Tritrichomonas foetus]|uniref:Signal sequence receptor subunit gamma n=1 Tax=Tritrichomonas foetus TaxID=1144522 RepID=A0A1J4L2F6_9EUKA|nr:hypothetical protein TRFO_13453 [Tritrichomonas foetus]|eukprot:OHT16126.1 hypothetical protein TRFO_13453 [Tritrichomonas foetus]
MSRNTRQTANTPEDEEAAFAGISPTKRPSSFDALKYLPFALLTSLLSILLYTSVRGLEIQNDLPYVIVGYLAGAAALTFAYHNVARWIKKQRSVQMKGTYQGSEGLWFTLFYNNAIYVFLLFICSHIFFTSFPAATSLVLTQLIATIPPAYLSSLSI